MDNIESMEEEERGENKNERGDVRRRRGKPLLREMKTIADFGLVGDLHPLNSIRRIIGSQPPVSFLRVYWLLRVLDSQPLCHLHRHPIPLSHSVLETSS